MKLNEEVNPSFNVERGLVGVNVDAARDNINILLNGVTNCSTVTPYIALERVRKVLAQFHIFLPKVTFMEGDHGVQTFPIQQFGEMMGMRNDGEVVSKVSDPYHLYFEYQMTDRGMFDVFCEIVNNDELAELLNDVEDEIDNEDAEDDREEKLDEGLLSKLGAAGGAYGAAKAMQAGMPSLPVADMVGVGKGMIGSVAKPVIDTASTLIAGGAAGSAAADLTKGGIVAATKGVLKGTGKKAKQASKKALSAIRSRNKIDVSKPGAQQPSEPKGGYKFPPVSESSESVKLSGPETGARTIDGAPEGMNVLKAYLKKKDQKLNEAKGLTKAELSAIRGAAKMKRKMENPRAKISAERMKPQDRKTKLAVKKKAENIYKSMAANMGNYDAQWRESERNNSAHASKDNIEKFMRLAKQEFDAARKAKPDMDEYRKKYFKHQERLKTLEGMMRRAKK